MTFALTQFKAYGVRASAATRQHTWQVAEFGITAANTDTALDISSDTSGSLGTFWTAAIANSTYGTLATNALGVIQAIVNNINTLQTVSSEALLTRQEVAASSAQVLAFTSAAISTGTSVSATVTGLLSTDTILAVTQATANANDLVPVAFGTPTTNTLPLTYAATSGANGTVRVAVLRTATTPVTAGTYGLTVTGHLPSITFASGDAPTTQILQLVWTMKDGIEAQVADYGAAF
jgi:hypothetical protein